MRKIIFLVMLVSQIDCLIASTINVETAKLVATNFILKKRSNATNAIKYVDSEADNTEAIYYAVNFNDGGWVLVSASNSTMPILGYSLVGEYKISAAKPLALLELLDTYKGQIKKVSKQKSANVEVSDKWTSLTTSSNLKSLKSYTPGRSLLNVPSRGGEVIWEQEENWDGGCTPSYNKFCPSSDDSDCDCDHKPVGCGAVAMGQIMWYWQWPHSYNWGLMPTLLRNTTPIEQSDAVAHLLRDCGNASDMVYWCSGSWTTVDEIVTAFKDDFNYKGVEKRTRKGWPFGIGGSWPSNVWMQMIRNEIDCERPVFYRGDKSDLSTSKHFFVITGYDSADPNLFRINWGWGGSYNSAYYSLDDLTPGSSEFNDNQMAIIGISPTCTGIPADITDVSYTTVTDNKSEYARNSITLPANGKSLTVKSGGNLSLSAGNSIELNAGFSVELGGTFEAFIAPSGCSNDCGMQLMHIDNAIIKGRNDYYGWFEIRAVNANSYEFVVMDRNNTVVYLGVGKLENNVTTTIWDGTGANFESVYLGALTLRNNCGERIYKNQDITVLLGSSKSAKSDTTESKVMLYSENTTVQTSIEPSSIIASNEFVIFPNPNDGVFSIETVSKNLPYTITITNNIGQVVYKSSSIDIESTQIKLPSNISGYCIAEIVSNNKRFFNKLIIK